VITAPNLNFDWLVHGFGQRDSVYPVEMTTVHQIHSARVLDACGHKGVRIGEGDAIVSTEAGVAIGIRTADCVPVLLADPETRTVACVHAGWRGTAENIVGATIRTLVSRGCRASALHAAIGPSIGFCCYKVGADVAQRFDTWMPPGSGEQRALDLPAINELQLREAAVRHIWKSGECTFCRPDRYFSFRREKERAGRMLSFVNRIA
jgi:YfiH family protein